MTARRESGAPRLVTSRFDRGYLYIPGVPSIVVMWLLVISTATPMVALVVILQVVIWGGWWWGWGRFWHPVQESRWEWAEYRLGRAYWNQDQVSFREVWEQTDGHPERATHAPRAARRVGRR